MLLQSESHECGLACLAMIASYHGGEYDLIELRRRFSISLNGTSLAQLMRYANALSLSSRALRLELEQLHKLRTPCILHWDLNHFIVLDKIIKTRFNSHTFKIYDPACGERDLTLNEVSRHFTGIALELTPSEVFHPKDNRHRLKVTELIGKVKGLKLTIFKIFLISLALEIFSLVSPLYSQLVVDNIIASGNHELLQALVIGFTLLILTQGATSYIRSRLLLYWGSEVSIQWATRVFSHLLNLPPIYFEKRHAGDLTSKFSSVESIQNTLTNIVIESTIDGLMTVLALILMLVYSAPLTILVLCATAAYSLLRIGLYQPLREATKERLSLSANESSFFLETIRGISTIKLFGRETERLNRWQNLRVKAQNKDIITQRLTIVFKTGNYLIFAMQGLLLFYFGANQILKNSMTIGMLFAFSSYATTFTSRISSLIDSIISSKMLNLHNERLADIVLENVEEENGQEVNLDRLSGTVTIRNLKFRYSEGEPWILNGINLTIPAGQSVALTGPSGCGKTTLCKVILGLLKPTEGEILIDNIPIAQIGYRSFRRIVGTVMQDDVLFSGSILDNIGFFDNQINYKNVELAAKRAAIHDEICTMPMGYQTLIGDLGSGISGGQKQRILLARALYKHPKILALDEATSHLDIYNEAKVNLALSKLELTRIFIAHRPETIHSTERVIRLEKGNISEVSSDKFNCDEECVSE